MSIFARIQNGIVVDVIVANQSHIDTIAGQWVEASETSEFRGHYTGIGHTYNEEHDVFYAPQPFPSWTISAPDWIWKSPSPIPTDEKKYYWDEPTLTWKFT